MTRATFSPATSPQQLLEQFPVDFLHLTPLEQRVSIALYRLLADGEPVTLDRLAGAVSRPEHEIAAMLRRWTGVYHNDHGEVIGYWGLTLHPTTHRFEAKGQRLYTWCAWDSLFLPAVLGTAARVESACPVTRDPIRLTVSPEAITEADPPDAVMSFLRCDPSRVQEDVISSFCHYVFFFSSLEAGRQWVPEHPGTFLVSLADAFELAGRKNASQYPDLLR